MEEYNDFIKKKQIKNGHYGFYYHRDNMTPLLFDYQKDLVMWALRKGKSALFTMTGTGKTYMEIEFSRVVFNEKGINVLIVAPLAVSEQIIEIAISDFGLTINKVKEKGSVDGISIINYDALHMVDVNNYGCIVLDESSILKSYSGKIRNSIIEMFTDYPFKLAATATPSPNDYMELGNHAEFLDVMKRREMLAMYFVHDGAETAKWRLKKHAEELFWEWVATWAAVMNMPSDLGYSDDGFMLPKLNEELVKIKTGMHFGNGFFSLPANTLSERREARRGTIDNKVDWIRRKVDSSNEIFLVWCDLNDESKAIAEAIKGSVEITGSDTDEHKSTNMLAFSKGNIRCLVTKPKIAGFGMNWQVCHNVIFCGLSDSFEQYFQAVRRCWRFGQKQQVNVWIVTTDVENKTLENIKRKEEETENMYVQMKNKVSEYLIKDLKEQDVDCSKYMPRITMVLPEWMKEKV